jgi:hypothetical protein
MAKSRISPEAFTFIVSTVSSLVHSCQAVAAAETDEGETSLGEVGDAFDDAGEHLINATEDWLQLLGAASKQVVKDFYIDYGIKKGE